MADRNNFEEDFNAFMAALFMNMDIKKMLNDKGVRIHPFKVEVTVTPISIDCHCEGNKSFLKDIEGGEEWFKETASLIDPIMKAQTAKFAELAKKNFGFEVVEKAETISNSKDFDEFLKNLFGGGKAITPNMENGLSAVTRQAD